MKKLIVLVAVGLSLTNGLFAQSVGKRITAEGEANYSKPTEGKLSSKLMQREMPYRVILPKDYSASKEKRYPVIYLLHGLFGSSANWTTLTKLPVYAQCYDAIIVTPEGENGWYTDYDSIAANKHESYIIKELIPEIDAKYRTISKREGRVIAGLSMGGYGALKFAFKYPEMFILAGSFSGALGAATYGSSPGMESIVKTIDDAMGPRGNATRTSNDLFAMVRNASPEKIKALPFVYLDCGTEDSLFFQNNREFVALLIEKKIPHEYRELPGAHNWEYWNKQVQEFLRVAALRLNMKPNSLL
jgi:putative tributyrin esterase